MPIRSSWIILAFALPHLNAQDIPIDTARSSINIHVGKAGLLSAAGHEHWVNAPIASGTIREKGAPHIAFKVESARMTVKPDPKIDAQAQATIQKHMEELTLETNKYPEISFESSRVVSSGPDQWKVQGNLSLHGVTKPVSVDVKRSGGAYPCRATLKQTDFEIKPISIGGA